ncbi:MAG: beta-ketoacyl-[acyl-carrier-protein] synthase family protein [Desulfobacter sp.]
MKRRAVITGLGILTPNGNGIDAAWDNLSGGNCAINRITKFDPEDVEGAYAGEVDVNIMDYIPRRLARKMDPFSAYAIIACQSAMEDAGLELEGTNKDRLGVYVGNTFGGWTFTDPQLRLLHTKGVRGISPFLASAWFPAAPQGQVTIFFQLKGQSKTFDSGRASGLASIGYGARAIQTGRADLMLAGGTEALVTPYIIAACNLEGVADPGHGLAPDGAYKPFDTGRQGWVIGEGAVFLLLEELDHALDRNARIYGEITGLGNVTVPCQPRVLPANGEGGLTRSMTNALKDADLAPGDIDLIMADALGTVQGDLQEAGSINKVFGSTVPVTAPKSMSGNLCGAAGAYDTALAALSMQHNKALPTVNLDQQDPGCDIDIVAGAPRDISVRNVLVNGRGYGGISTSLVISAFNG